MRLDREGGLVRLTVTHPERGNPLDRCFRAEFCKIANRLAKEPTAAYAATRRLLLSARTERLEAKLELEVQALAQIAVTGDAREGLAAIAAKRPAGFTGH